MIKLKSFLNFSKAPYFNQLRLILIIRQKTTLKLSKNIKFVVEFFSVYYNVR